MTATTSPDRKSGQFPATRWSAILAVRSSDADERRRGLETVAAAYWKPIYKYIRLRWNKSSEDAADLTQEFFSRLVEKKILDGFDPRKARLRTFLRVCVDRLVANEGRAASRKKRGGNAPHVSLDVGEAEADLRRSGQSFVADASTESMNDFLEKEFLRSVFGLAVAELRKNCRSRHKELQFRVFQRYDLEDSTSFRPGYQDIARELGISLSDVTNSLSFARREFRRILLEKLREMTASEEEFQREARHIFGAKPE